jgi:hypothetical protein
MRNCELEREIANEIYRDFSRKNWPTEPPSQPGNVGYCGPDVTTEPTDEEDEE